VSYIPGVASVPDFFVIVIPAAVALAIIGAVTIWLRKK